MLYLWNSTQYYPTINIWVVNERKSNQWICEHHFVDNRLSVNEFKKDILEDILAGYKKVADTVFDLYIN